MYNKRFQGFTLIELLVVIAIIGILSAVVLASLSTARSKGYDAAIQSDLTTAQTQAEVYYGGAGGNSYGATAGATCNTAGSMFVADATIAKAIAGAISASNNTAANVTCGSSASAYAISAKLVASTTQYWCVDSTGTSKSTGTQLANGATVCP